MHVTINALHVYPGATGGGETHLIELSRALSELDSDTRYTVLIWPQAEAIIRPLRNERLNYRVIQRTPVHRLVRGALRTVLPPHPTGWLANLRTDLMHWPNAVIMLKPFSLAVPSVLTMTDIQHEYFPEFFTPDDLALRRVLFPDSLRRADAVIAISNFTRQTLIERYAVPPEKITTIYHGIHAARFATPAAPEHIAQIRARYALPERFLLYPAGTWPHKNHLRLLQALARTPGVSLILTGIRQRAHDDVLKSIADLGLSERVRHIGHVGWDEMPPLYQMATGVIFPSLFEGFGFPVLEAMAAGCPTAASNQAAIVEVTDGASLYFDPLDVEPMADAIRRLWTDDALRQHLIDAGRPQAARFSWPDVAHQTVEVYKATVSHQYSGRRGRA